jgi:uncharacterized protein (TIGR02246 family)
MEVELSVSGTLPPGLADAIDRLYQRLARCAESGDYDGYASLFDPRAALVLPKCAPIEGQDGVRAWAREFMETWDVRSDLFQILDRREGDTVAFVRFHGAGRYLPKRGGAAVPFDHNYIDVLVREPGGEWRIAVHQAGPATTAPTAWD